jgi:heat shock protein HslJ
MFLTLISCLFSFNFSSMNTNAPIAPSPIKGMWVLQDITDKIGVTKGTFIKLEADSYYLYAGCNHISGNLVVKGDSMKFEQGMSTLMACTNMDYEAKLTAILLKSATYTVSENKLTVTTSDKKTLTFKRQTALEHLTGKTFEVIGLTINGGVTSSVDQPLQTLKFGEKGILSGTAGCNNYTATYKIEGDKLYITKVSSTKKACKSAKIKEYDTIFKQHLQKSPLTIEDSTNDVTLRDSKGAIVMTLKEE